MAGRDTVVTVALLVVLIVLTVLIVLIVMIVLIVLIVLECFYDIATSNRRLHEPENKELSPPLQAAKLQNKMRDRLEFIITST